MLTTTVKTGQQIPDFLHNHRLLPPGSQINRGGYHYTVDAPGVFSITNRNSHGDFSQNHWGLPFELAKLDADHLQLPEYDTETLLWRIRDAAISAAERSGVHLYPVIEMVDAIGCTTPRFRLGEVISNHHDMTYLPDKSVLYCGDPSKPGRFTVYRMRNQALQPVLGMMANRQPGSPVVLYEAKGIDAAPSEVTPADKVEVARLALKAWRIGKRYKARQNWCGVFDETLSMLGIDDSVAETAGECGRTVGEILTKEQVAHLPVGTLLAWQFDRSDAVAVYRRVVAESVRNVSGTRRIWGTDAAERNNHEQMTIIQMPGDQAHWRVNGRVINQCPPGVRFYLNTDPANVMTTPHEVPYWQSYLVVEWPR